MFVYRAAGALEDETLPAGFYPWIDIEWTYLDNVFRTESNESSDSAFVVKPALNWRTRYGKHFLDLSYLGDYGTFLSLDEQNYIDHNVNADVKLDLTKKFNVDLGGFYTRSHERPQAPGTPSEDFREPTRWYETGVMTRLTYGRSISTGQFVLTFHGNDRRFTNNDQQNRDRNTYDVVLDFYYRILPKTRILTEMRYDMVDFRRSLRENEDFKGYSFLLGATWEATANTTGRALVGFLHRDIEDDAFDDFSGVDFEADIVWSPKPYSAVTLTAARTTEASGDRGTGFFLADRFSLGWRHRLIDLLWLNTSVAFERDDFISEDRDDKYINFDIEVSYRWKRWLETGIGYHYENRDSSRLNRDYDSNIVGVFLKLLPTFERDI